MKGIIKHIFQSALVLGLLLAGEGVVWGTSYYYAKLTVGITDNSPAGAGAVYATPDGKVVQDVSSRKTTAENYTTTSGKNVDLWGHAVSNEGFHFLGWTDLQTNTVPDPDFEGNPQKFTLTPSSTAADSETKHNEKNYNRYAIFAKNYYAILYVQSMTGASGTATGNGTKNTETPNGELEFNLKASDASIGYHFTGWKGAGITFSSSESLETTAKVNAAPDGGLESAKQYTATANYELNVYWARLEAGTSGNGTAKVEVSEMSTNNPGSNVTFKIIAEAASGYHFVNWTKSGDEGDFENENSSTTTFTAPAANEYDKEKAKSYTVTAHFAVDEYNAKLTSAVSSLSEGTGHSVCVSTDGNNWVESKSKSASAPNSDVTFYVKAEPAPGYKFIGWSESDGSSDTVTGLGAEGTFVVKSSSTQGGTNEKTLYAIFKKEYSITINANSSATDPKGKIVFKIVSKSDGGKKYRVSVPVGGSITLKDVGEGGYTITPETIWHWSYKVEPASDETDYDANNLSTNNFTVTPSGKNKKHDEASSTVTEPGA